jgi:hypothetical protein
MKPKAVYGIPKYVSKDESMDVSSMPEDNLPITSDQFRMSFESSDEKVAFRTEIVSNLTV